jgi:hypothetical protein
MINLESITTREEEEVYNIRSCMHMHGWHYYLAERSRERGKQQQRTYYQQITPAGRRRRKRGMLAGRLE